MRLITTVAVCAALLLAGCGSDTTTPKEPKASSSPTSSVAPPEMPEQAKEDSDEGAAAFVTYYVELMNYAAATGETSILKRLSLSDCEGCTRYRDYFESTHADLGKARTNSVGPKIVVRDFGEESTATVELTTAEGPTTTGSIAPAATETVTFGVVRASEGWVVRQVYVGEPSA